MDLRAVLILLCALFAQTACRPAEITAALNATIQPLREQINASLNNMVGLFPNKSCPNVTGLEELQQQPPPPPLGPHHLSYFTCYMKKMLDTRLPQQLSSQLRVIAQTVQSVERLAAGRPAADQTCSLTRFEADKDRMEFVKCLLQLLNQSLDGAAF